MAVHVVVVVIGTGELVHTQRRRQPQTGTGQYRLAALIYPLVLEDECLERVIGPFPLHSKHRRDRGHAREMRLAPVAGTVFRAVEETMKAGFGD